MCCFWENIKKQAALHAIAAHCVFKVNASFYFFAFLLFTFFSLDFYSESQIAPTNICLEIWTIWPKKIRQVTCKILCYLFGFIRNEAGQSLIIILTKPTGCLYLRRLCTNERFFPQFANPGLPIDLSTVFSTCDVDKLGKIYTTGKSALKLVKLSRLKVFCWKLTKIIAPQSREMK